MNLLHGVIIIGLLRDMIFSFLAYEGFICQNNFLNL